MAFLWKISGIDRQKMKLSWIEFPPLGKSGWKPRIGQSSEHEALINFLENQKCNEPKDKLVEIYMQNCI